MSPVIERRCIRSRFDGRKLESKVSSGVEGDIKSPEERYSERRQKDERSLDVSVSCVGGWCSGLAASGIESPECIRKTGSVNLHQSCALNVCPAVGRFNVRQST